MIDFLPPADTPHQRRALFGLRAVSRAWCGGFALAVRLGWRARARRFAVGGPMFFNPSEPTEAEAGPDWVAAVARGRGTTEAEALVWACGVGVLHPVAALRHAARTGSADALDALAPDARLVRRATEQPGADALCLAAAGGHVEALGRLARPPWSLVSDDRYFDTTQAVAVAARNGQAAAVGALFAAAAAAGVRSSALVAAALDYRVTDHARMLEVVARAAPAVDDDTAASLLGSAASAGAEALRRMAEPPFSLGRRHVVRSAAFVLGCAARVGCAGFVDELAQPPWSVTAGDLDADEWTAVLMSAAKGGHVAVLERLAEPPYAGAGWNAFAALCHATRAPDDGAFGRLLLPPFSAWPPAPGMMRHHLLFFACSEGREAFLDRLVAPPFGFGAADALACGVLCAAAAGGHVAVIDRLGGPPFSLRSADVDAAWQHALDSALPRPDGHADVVGALARLCEPHEARAAADRAGLLRAAVAHSAVTALDRLALPPFSFAKADVVRHCRVVGGGAPVSHLHGNARAAERWLAARGAGRCRGGDVVSGWCEESIACTFNAVPAHGGAAALVGVIAARGHTTVVDRLTQPPYSFDGEDARACDCAAFCWAAACGTPGMLRRLAEPPFSLTRADVAGTTAWIALQEALTSGNVAVAQALADEPYRVGREDAPSATSVGALVLLAAGVPHALRWLAGPPLRVTHEDLVDVVDDLREWLLHNPMAVWMAGDVLARPPFSVKGIPKPEPDGMRFCCCHGPCA